MDPEVRRYFKKIINSFSFGLIWLLSAATAGFYFRLARVSGTLQWYNWAFYGFFILSLFLLVYYLYRTWRQ